eukprot:jgi/Undpi1/5122/HiC_scaffold_19.g08474.m1
MLTLHGKAYHRIFDLQEKYETMTVNNSSRFYIYDSEFVDKAQQLGIDLGVAETLRTHVRENISWARQFRAAVDDIIHSNAISSEPAFISFAETSRVNDGNVLGQEICAPEIAAILYTSEFTNQHLRNCLLDKAKGTDNAAFACNAAVKDIGKECTTCVQADPVIKEGDVLLSSAPLGTRLHYTCARKKRKDFLRLVFGSQDKRHKNYLKKEQESAEKKLKVESAVGFAALAPDSDDDL